MVQTSTVQAPADDHVDVDGYATTVRRRGSGRTVVFLHGAFFPTLWTPTHERLAEKFDLVAPLHPGYAEGGPPAWMLGVDDLVLHYRGLLDGLDLDRVDLVGYDLGAWIGGLVAAYYPERFRSFTAVAPMGMWVPEAPMFEFLAADPARVAAAVFNGDVEGRGHLFPPPDADDIDAFVATYGQNGVTARLIWERRYDVGLARKLARVRLPSLVLVPADDRILSDEHARAWVEALPDARLEVVDGPGHGMVLQAPQAVADAIAANVSEVPA